MTSVKRMRLISMHGVSLRPVHRFSSQLGRPLPRPPHKGSQSYRDRGDRIGVGKLKAKKEVSIQVDPTPTGQLEQQRSSGVFNCWVPLAVVLLGSLLYRPIRERLSPLMSKDYEEEDDEVTYRRAVARTRQAIYVNRAIGFMNANAPARVIVELQRALKENAVCRSELLSASHSQLELQGLYRIHLTNEEVPPEYAVLLQLREMLGISVDDAEKIERDVEQTDAFII